MTQTNQQILETLQRVKQRIATKQTWCQYALAATASNYALTDPSDDSACKWCLIGAIMREAIERHPIYAQLNYDVGNVLCKGLILRHSLTLPIINDKLGFDAVHKLLDHSIEQLSKENNNGQ